MWRYVSPIGPLFIQKLSNGRYGLFYNDTIWESCHSLEAEAGNVYMHCTGCSKWDVLDGQVPDVPMDLSEWEVI